MKQVRFWLIAAIVLMLAACAREAEPRVEVTQAWARATPPQSPVGAAFVDLRNAGAQADRLTGVSSPVAARVEIHTMEMEGDIMKMRELERVELAPGENVTMKPGGMHLMLMELNQPLTGGERFPLTLTFERAPPLTIDVRIAPLGSSAPPQD